MCVLLSLLFITYLKYLQVTSEMRSEMPVKLIIIKTLKNISYGGGVGRFLLEFSSISQCIMLED